MKRQRSHDILETLLALADAAEPITALKTVGRGAPSLVGCHYAGAIDPFCETIAHMVQGARTGAQRQR